MSRKSYATLALLLFFAGVVRISGAPSNEDPFLDIDRSAHSDSDATANLDSLAVNDVIVLNSGLRVPFGRSVELDRQRHLKIVVRPGDHCVVRVLDDHRQSLSRHPGRLTPTNFPCEFGEADQVRYTHFGSRSPSHHRVRLLVRYSIGDDEIVMPFTVNVRVLFDQQQEVVIKNIPLTVDKLRGDSNAIDSKVLQFAYNRERHLCRLLPLRGAGVGLPRYGELTEYVLTEDERGMVDCEEFLRANVRYRHLAADSPNRDYVPLLVVLLPAGDSRLTSSDSDASLFLKREYFQLTVRIKEARDNTPPRVSDSSLLLMDVSQFVTTPVTLSVVSAEDDETPAAELLFNVTSNLGFGDGQLVSTDDNQNFPVTSFTQNDLEELKIAYKPPASDSDVRRIFTVSLEVLDAEDLSSRPFTLLITVNPMNSLSPVVTRNTGITLFEGQSRKLHSAKNLEISDEDNIDDVTVTVASGLRHGQLLLIDSPVKRFSPADLDAGLIRYQHDGSDTTTDNIVLSMSDGQHPPIEFLFPVTIFPRDDQPPVLTTNTGITMRKKLEAEITPFVLSASDVDSDDDSILFRLMSPGPLYGELILRRLAAPDDEELDQGWVGVTQVEDGVSATHYERPVTEFTQRDINDGLLLYRHLGEHHSHAVLDAVTFQLSDDSTPPNVSKEKQFLVNILPLDDVPPELQPGTSLRMTVDEFQLTEFTRTHLSYTDADSDDRALRYTVTRPLTDLDANGAGTSRDVGALVLSEDPEAEVVSFTQAQINHHKIAYRPPSIEMGLTPRVIQFEFQVEDGAGNAMRGQLFDVVVQPINNKPPQITNRGFRVIAGGQTRVDTSVLDASDRDTDPGRLVFRLLDPPRHGTLLLRDVALAVGDEFLREDLDAGTLVYVNSGVDQRLDQFLVEVSDGVHRVPATVLLTIRPAGDGAPKIRSDGTEGTLVLTLSCVESKSVILDPDSFGGSEADPLTFVLEVKPRFGELRVNGKRVTRFSREQLRRGVVRYVHTAGEVGLQRDVRDGFNLSLSDKAGAWTIGDSIVHRIQVNVTIEPVNNIAPNVTIVRDGGFTVDEGGVAAIGVQHLSVTDKDTDEEGLVCTILVQPVQGYVENVVPLPGSERSRAGIPITAFSVADLRGGTVNYVQSIHQGVEPREDAFVLQCSDGVNQSPRVTFVVKIRPINDERPTLMTSGDFTVLEGMQLVIDITVLSARDLDLPPDRLVFQVTRKPRHGKIIMLSPEGAVEIDGFTEEQMGVTDADGGAPSGQVAYWHDDSETSEDSFELSLSDGHSQYVVNHTVRVSVLATDDETPRLTVNNGLEVEVGDARPITGRELRAEDVDTDNAKLTYVLRLAPSHGHLVKVVRTELLSPPLSDISARGEALTTAQRVNLTRGDNFTQADVDRSLIIYVHDGNHEEARDLIKFDVTDGINPLIDRHFYVTVSGTDNVYPDVVNRGVELPEGGRVTLTTDILSTSDLNSDNRLLTFTVTRAPSHGQLENSDQPGAPIATFRQIELAGNKIGYVHTDSDETKMDSFEFEVSDGFNSIFRTFRISLTDVDNKRPVVFVGKLSVREGGHRTLTPFEVKIEDRDTPDFALRMTVTRGPQHGSLLFNRTSSPVTTFTMADVEAHLIGYQHDGSESSSDNFRFVVSDGTHEEFFVYPNTERPTRRAPTVAVEVIPVDNKVPYLSANRGASSLAALLSPTFIDGDERVTSAVYGFQFTGKSLKAQDRDSPEAELMFVVTDLPRHGRLISKAKSNATVDNFTQGDIDEGNILYVLNSGENATGDIFHFKVMDKGNNELSGQDFRLNWAWISLEYDSYSVNESETHLRINLRRRGYLAETSFVGLKTVEKSAKRGHDFHKSFAKQVQFNPGQSEATWRIRIIDDVIYERQEMFQITLEDPILAAVEYPDMASITIVDHEDESVVSFVDTKYEVDEHVGEFSIPLQRKGDLSGELSVICSTESGTATGTVPLSILSFSDYISRTADSRHTVNFDVGQSSAACPVIVIDDSTHEEAEWFRVILSDAVGGRVDTLNRTQVVIASDQKDVPTFFFGEPAYSVDESDGFLELTVWRSGTDLSRTANVVVQSRPSKPSSATASRDYLGVGVTLDYAAGVAMSTFRVTILDDVGRPRLEGLETFEVVLFAPVNGTLGIPSKSVVTINDTSLDGPLVQFAEIAYTVEEMADQVIRVVVLRSGDLSLANVVRCYTRQDTATVQADFVERPDSDESLIAFAVGQSESSCTVTIVNDELHEPDEQFRLHLGPASADGTSLRIGSRNVTRVTIADTEDRSVVGFERTRYNIREPRSAEEAIAILEIAVIRRGDATRSSATRLHTKDGSAKSGEDYHGLTREIVFEPGERRVVVPIEILFDSESEHRETFMVHLKPDKYHAAGLGETKVIVYIQDDKVVTHLTFPSPPIVASLRDYDSVVNKKQPISGYPVICITSCDHKHPDFTKTGSLCTKEGINNSLAEYRWRVGAPGGQISDVEGSVFFASSKLITLDSVYFSAGGQVQCGARVVDEGGVPGRETMSEPVIVADKGLCDTRSFGSFGAEPFVAKMRYVGPDDDDFVDDSRANTVRLTVTLPHHDGMMPLVSTRSLSNFELTLSRDGVRIGDHRCSNMIDYKEDGRGGFTSSNTRNPNIIGELEPYQYSQELRGERTLRFYQNLDLESCMWEFVGYFGVSELVSECGGDIVTENADADADLVQSRVTVRVPLYVSYVFSGSRVGEWQHNDMQTQLRLAFVYDTAILWKNGITAMDESPLRAQLFPLSMHIHEDGRLVVKFRTEVQFHGRLVAQHPGSPITAGVVSRSQPEMTFTLSLVRDIGMGSSPTGQEWTFTSDFAAKDYSGSYHIRLVPCLASPEMGIDDAACSPSSEPLNFQLRIRFQQVSDPVPARYTLNTLFRVTKNRDLWLENDSSGFIDSLDTSFHRGDLIYGSIVVDPLQSLGTVFHVSIEKCFICSGINGYVPKYSPTSNEYGCMLHENSDHSLQAFKIIDRRAPNTVSDDYNGISFNATLLTDDLRIDVTSGKASNSASSDVFHFNSSALFHGAAGRQWFLHCIYVIRSEKSRSRRTITDENMAAIGVNGRGTNMLSFSLVAGVTNADSTGMDSESLPVSLSVIVLSVSLCALSLIAVAALVISKVYHRVPFTSAPKTIVTTADPVSSAKFIPSSSTVTVIDASKSNLSAVKLKDHNIASVQFCKYDNTEV